MDHTNPQHHAKTTQDTTNTTQKNTHYLTQFYSTSPLSSWHPDFLYMAAIALDGVIFASQILFTTSLYTFFGKKDFGIKYGLVRAGPGLAVLGFSFLLKYVNIFEEWSVIYHSMAIICIFSGMVSIALTNHSVVKL